MQTVSSMNTSINTTRLPAVWGKINWDYVKIHAHNPECPNIVDYGCGKPQTANMARLVVRNHYLDKERLGQFGCHYGYFPYDPYWGDVSGNQTALRCLTEYNEADLCICANVLNVIDDSEEISNIIKRVTLARYWAFSIYEGDKSGKGKYTKGGTCYQRNLRTKEYLKWFIDLAITPYYSGNIITNSLSLLK